MPTLTYPGVYIQEISSGVRPIEVASTSTAAFVGLAEMGPEEAHCQILEVSGMKEKDFTTSLRSQRSDERWLSRQSLRISGRRRIT